MAKGVYRRYKGSRQRKGILVPSLIALCALAAIVLIYINFNLEDGGDGTTILSLPFTDSTIVFGEPEVNLVVEEPVDVVVEVERKIPEYETRVETMAEIALDDDFEENLKGIEDKNTVAIRFKDEWGEVADKEDAKKACAQIKKAGFNACAVISCFRDDDYARENPDLAISYDEEELWEDDDECAWLNPYSDDCVEYVCGVIENAYEAGFTEVLLVNVGFPVDDEIEYDEEMEKEEVISAFLENVKEICNEKEDLNVAIYFDGEDNGQDISFIAGNFYRIYTNDSDIYNKVETLIPEENLETRIVVVEEE